MTKPNWSEAPEWARYLAMSNLDKWYWYEREPYPGCGRWHAAEGRSEQYFASQLPWDMSLQRKPDWELVLINSYGFKYSFTWLGLHPPTQWRFPLPTKVIQVPSDSMPDMHTPSMLTFHLRGIEGNVATYKEVSI